MNVIFQPSNNPLIDGVFLYSKISCLTGEHICKEQNLYARGETNIIGSCEYRYFNGIKYDLCNF